MKDHALPFEAAQRLRLRVQALFVLKNGSKRFSFNLRAVFCLVKSYFCYVFGDILLQIPLPDAISSSNITMQLGRNSWLLIFRRIASNMLLDECCKNEPFSDQFSIFINCRFVLWSSICGCKLTWPIMCGVSFDAILTNVSVISIICDSH